ncbi:MAG: FAD-binding oxidoreductase [Lachnospiraceae bacterium]|nr:FAD-binding oxidoreductase [Lachnospiraceae bacterium]
MTSERFDKIIIGAGLYGLYAALFCCNKGQKVVILECESAPFKRATYANQARVHQGYHYPRSISTAMKSAGYFERFCRDFDFCINSKFDQIYATSGRFSWTDGKQFKSFCEAAGIPCEEVNPDDHFQKGMCDGAFKTQEYTYDALILRDHLLEKLKESKNPAKLIYGVNISSIEKTQDSYVVNTENKGSFESGFVLNATYAGTNQILDLAGFDKFRIKYELCEIILCEVNETLHKTGFTVMDGPFFSIMPFGKTGLHSLTSVAFTPHDTSYGEVPEFSCQERSGDFCSKLRLGNCNDCPARPDTAFAYMSGLAHKYLPDRYEFKYKQSLYSMKPVLTSSEIDDSRPTLICKYSDDPVFVAVLSGKINTVYDLEEFL